MFLLKATKRLKATLRRAGASKIRPPSRYKQFLCKHAIVRHLVVLGGFVVIVIVTEKVFHNEVLSHGIELAAGSMFDNFVTAFEHAFFAAETVE